MDALAASRGGPAEGEGELAFCRNSSVPEAAEKQSGGRAGPRGASRAGHWPCGRDRRSHLTWHAFFGSGGIPQNVLLSSGHLEEFPVAALTAPTHVVAETAAPCSLASWRPEVPHVTGLKARGCLCRGEPLPQPCWLLPCRRRPPPRLPRPPSHKDPAMALRPGGLSRRGAPNVITPPSPWCLPDDIQGPGS